MPNCYSWASKLTKKAKISCKYKSKVNIKVLIPIPFARWLHENWPLLWMCRTGYCTESFLEEESDRNGKNEYQSLFLHFVNKILISVSMDFL